ncbi:hypothetical protein bcgnr5378_36920 [Bacillus cereus]
MIKSKAIFEIVPLKDIGVSEVELVLNLSSFSKGLEDFICISPFLYGFVITNYLEKSRFLCGSVEKLKPPVYTGG